MTLGNGLGILKGQFRFSSQATQSHLMKNLDWAHPSQTCPVKPGWFRTRARTEDATWSRNNNSSPRPSGSQPGWEGRGGGREKQRGPAAASWNNTRPTRDNREPPADLISPPRSAFPREPDCHAAVISHVTEHQSHGADGALAPAEADLQTLAGNTITRPPRPSSPMRLREERREGGEEEEEGRASGHWKQRLAPTTTPPLEK